MLSGIDALRADVASLLTMCEGISRRQGRHLGASMLRLRARLLDEGTHTDDRLLCTWEIVTTNATECGGDSGPGSTRSGKSGSVPPPAPCSVVRIAYSPAAVKT